MVRIAFYAPMKPPDHPTPSGDRTMARSFMAALARGGHAVELASRLRLHLRMPDAIGQTALAQAAEVEISMLAQRWRNGPPPDLWFTYHNYHKAPDLLGPTLARHLGIPYVVAEASHAARRATAWGSWFAAAEDANRAADLHICLTGRDKAGLAPLLRPDIPRLDLPPFIDLDGFPPASARQASSPVRLVTVAMMRPGDKLDSYRFLANALTTICDLDWTLAIVGDGPARADVEDAFASLPARRLVWHGALASADMRRCLADKHIFVWPGFGEAFGLAYLEAQALGLPVVALDVAGVSSVVVHGQTGTLAAEPVHDLYGEAIATLITDDDRRVQLARAASCFVREERTLDKAAQRLDSAIQVLMMP